jgi:hypothetical protein
MGLQRVQTTLTSPFEECLPRHLFLKRKVMWMKLKECIIIFDKTMSRNKIFMCTGNMKNIIQMNVTNWGLQSAITNVINLHTCPVCREHLLVAVILVTKGELLKVAGDMIRGTGVDVPVGIYPIGGSARRRDAFLRWPGEIGVKALEAAHHGVALLAIELTEDTLEEVAATTAIVAVSTATAVTTETSTATIIAAARLLVLVGIGGGPPHGHPWWRRSQRTGTRRC